MERLKAAMTRFRRNRRELRKAKGLASARWLEQDYTPLGDASVFDGVDATAEELVLHLLERLSIERGKVALLTKWSLAGLATEMAMHETNSQLYSLRSWAERFLRLHPDDPAAIHGLAAVQSLGDNFGFLTRFRAGALRDSAGTPAGAYHSVMKEFSQSIARGTLVVEATPAFLSSDFRGDARVLHAVFVNLVRNAAQWATRSGKNPAVVRLGAKRTTWETTDWDDEREESYPVVAETDILLVEDNGPGVDRSVGDIFEPSVSGRGSAGIGLHLCRAVLEAHGDTVVLSPALSELGGAVFMVGKHAVLRNNEDRLENGEAPREVVLARGLESMRELVEAGYNAEAAELSDVYEEAAGMAMRIRLRGAETTAQARLVEAVDAMALSLSQAVPITGPETPVP
jgi:signal transduction histidine kinase